MARVRPRTTGSLVREQSPVFALVLIQAFTFCVALQGDSDDLSKWKTFSSRAGWNMKYPRDWQVGSCNSCPDPADPNVFVSFYSPQSDELLMIEHLADKPQGQSVRQWIDDVKTKAIL